MNMMNSENTGAELSSKKAPVGLHGILKSDPLTYIKQKGFTLIELMVVVVIATILIAIAVPIYHHIEMRSHRSEAMTALEHLSAQEEAYYTRYNQYAPTLTYLGYTESAMYPTPNNYYAVSISHADSDDYLLVAQPQGSQTQDQCGTFTLNSQGVKGVTGNSGSTTASSCWK